MPRRMIDSAMKLLEYIRNNGIGKPADEGGKWLIPNAALIKLIRTYIGAGAKLPYAYLDYMRELNFIEFAANDSFVINWAEVERVGYGL